MRTVTLVGKGPTAEKAQDWIDAEPGTMICCINDSARLLRRDVHVDYCFFTHFNMIERALDCWDRIGLFVSPDVSGWEDGPLVPMKLFRPSRFPSERWVTYGQRYNCGTVEVIENAVLLRQVVHHHTTAAALSWLIAMNHQRIRIIGVDGGGDYASGMANAKYKSPPFDEWKAILKNLADVAKRQRGVVVEWYK